MRPGKGSRKRVSAQRLGDTIAVDVYKSVLIFHDPVRPEAYSEIGPLSCDGWARDY